MEPVLSVNAPSIVSEIIDGEAVIMDLSSGHYFSTQGSGAEVWAGIEAGLPRSGIVERLAGVYDCDRSELEVAVDAFVVELLERRLVIETIAPGQAIITSVWASPSAGHVRQAFAVPALNAYADMEDLLLLDPIHDVDAVGWPTAKPADQPPL